MKPALSITPALLAILAATPATAEQFWFTSPSGNIQCVLSEYDTEQVAECHIIEATPSFTTAPEDCDLDWGNRFFLLNSGSGQRSCWSDYYFRPKENPLPYGGSVTIGRITCTSAKTGVTCTNTQGGGFSLRRSEQRIF